mgnify:CR=1 FL=1
MGEQQKWIDEVLVPNAKGEFRLGAEVYDTKMKFALMSDISRPELKARAEAAFAEARAQMEQLARTFPDCAGGSQQQAIECALEKTYEARPARHELEDKARLLDGLEGALAGSQAFDRARVSQILSALGRRVFLLHNVHEDAPVLFETRWVMSYLAGPLTLTQILQHGAKVHGDSQVVTWQGSGARKVSFADSYERMGRLADVVRVAEGELEFLDDPHRRGEVLREIIAAKLGDLNDRLGAFTSLSHLVSRWAGECNPRHAMEISA